MKRDKIIYWVATGLISSAMLTSAFMYLTKHQTLVAGFNAIGLPIYFLALLGVAKFAGAVMLLIPAWERLKEWAYAGFAFTFIGATWIHLVTGTPWIAPVVFLIVLSLSYAFRLRLR